MVMSNSVLVVSGDLEIFQFSVSSQQYNKSIVVAIVVPTNFVELSNFPYSVFYSGCA